MWQAVQLKVGIYGVNFGYNVKMGVYANSSLDISKLCAKSERRRKVLGHP